LGPAQHDTLPLVCRMQPAWPQAELTPRNRVNSSPVQVDLELTLLGDVVFSWTRVA